MSKAFQAEFVDKGILKIVFDLPDSKVNLFNAETIRELDRLIEELKKETAIKAAYLVSGKENNFLAGAEVGEIMNINSSEDGYAKSRVGQTLFERWRQLPFPTLAVVNGSCVGGGTEWILAFSYRMGSDRPETQIGLPEVKLGIIPGWGGTVRLPGLVGVKNALKLVLSGNTVSGKEAYNLCLTDDLAPHKILDEAALFFLKKILNGGERDILNRRKKNPARRGLLESTRFGRNIVFKRSRKRILMKTGGNYPAPLAALQSVMFSCDNSLEDALMFEARKFAVLAASRVCKNLVRLYFFSEGVKKWNGVENREIRPQGISKIGIVGAGQAGRGIAHLAVSHNYPVRLKDVEYPPLSAALNYAKELFDTRIRKGRLSPRQAESKMDLLSPTIEYSGFALTDLVIETITEDRILKNEIFKKIDRCTPANTILASNTATMSISELAKNCRRPECVAGFHFFYPAQKTRLVEIIRGQQTSAQTIATLFALAREWGKFPIVVADKPGFLLNRLLLVYLTEALALLENGAAIPLIDKSMTRFGMPKGPFHVLDEMGVDTALNMAKALQKQLHKRLPPLALFEALIKNERLGIKKGKGFYLPGKEKDGRSKVDKKIYKELDIRLKRGFEPLEIQERLLFLMVNEAAVCLEEGIVSGPEAIDAATIFGMGFPAFRGGLLRFASEAGIAKIMGRLWYFSEMVGERYAAAPLLQKISESETEIYEYLETVRQGLDPAPKKERPVIRRGKGKG